MTSDIDSVDELCEELEAVLSRSRAGGLHTPEVAAVLLDYRDRLEQYGYIPMGYDANR